MNHPALSSDVGTVARPRRAPRHSPKRIKRLPSHIAIIPDGNRRWAVNHGLPKELGYHYGLPVGLQLYEEAVARGVKELTFYGFTVDNTKRPSPQTAAFKQACVDAVELLAHRDASILVVGDTHSHTFPKGLVKYTSPFVFGKDLIRINFLVNYGWQWDLHMNSKAGPEEPHPRSKAISRIDLVIRWGGRRRLSGMLPIQTVYSDFYVVDELWPDFKPQHFTDALLWYQEQDVTLGG